MSPRHTESLSKGCTHHLPRVRKASPKGAEMVSQGQESVSQGCGKYPPGMQKVPPRGTGNVCHGYRKSLPVVLLVSPLDTHWESVCCCFGTLAAAGDFCSQWADTHSAPAWVPLRIFLYPNDRVPQPVCYGDDILINTHQSLHGGHGDTSQLPGINGRVATCAQHHGNSMPLCLAAMVVCACLQQSAPTPGAVL